MCASLTSLAPALSLYVLSPPLTCRLFCTRLWITVGSGAMPAPGAGPSGSWGGPPSLGLWTVVKQMLYSCGSEEDEVGGLRKHEEKA